MCHSVFGFRLKALFALMDMSKFKDRKNALQKLRDESVNPYPVE